MKKKQPEVGITTDYQYRCILRRLDSSNTIMGCRNGGQGLKNNAAAIITITKATIKLTQPNFFKTVYKPMMASMVTIVSPINFTFDFEPKIQHLSQLIPFVAMLKQGFRIKTTKELIGGENVEEPCKGDTPAQPRAQALG